MVWWVSPLKDEGGGAPSNPHEPPLRKTINYEAPLLVIQKGDLLLERTPSATESSWRGTQEQDGSTLPPCRPLRTPPDPREAYISKCPTATWGSLIETFVCLTLSISISWLWPCTLIFQTIAIGGDTRMRGPQTLPYCFLKLCANLQLSQNKKSLIKTKKND